MTAPDALLSIENLCIRFPVPGGELRAVEGVSLVVRSGLVHGLVGESGCGKSVTGLSIARLLPSPPAKISGRILFRGRDLLSLPGKELCSLRGRDISYVFQEPQVSFNPVLTVGAQIVEAVRLHLPGTTDAGVLVAETLRQVGIADPERRMNDYPHQLSGGMLQRAMIAMAVVCRPGLIIADEPTTALDVTVQAQIIELLARICLEEKLSLLIISHDLGVIFEIADEVSVMYSGKIVEHASKDRLFDNPLHPYTRGLLDSLPRPESGKSRLSSIPGRVRPVTAPETGCLFADRCPRRMPRCTAQVPGLFEPEPGHTVRCFLCEPPSPKTPEPRHAAAD